MQIVNRLTSLHTYRIINLRFQRILYENLQEYRLDLDSFFNAIGDLQYVAIKAETPYMVDNFPKEYPIGKDIDIVVVEEDFSAMVQNLIEIASSDHRFRVCIIKEDHGLRLRLELGGVLHYQIHVSYLIDNLTLAFIKKSVAGRCRVRNFYIPELTYEIIFRLADHYEHPAKAHHGVFIRKHADSIDWDLIDNPVMKHHCRLLVSSPSKLNTTPI